MFVPVPSSVLKRFAGCRDHGASLLLRSLPDHGCPLYPHPWSVLTMMVQPHTAGEPGE